MPIISKETWEKFTQEEKEEIRKAYLSDMKDKGESYYDGSIDTFIQLFGKEQLQPKLTYEDVAREMFEDGAYQFRDGFTAVGEKTKYEFEANPTWGLNLTSEKQAEKLLAINKLMNVAKYLNGKDWKPEYGIQVWWSIGIDRHNGKINPIDTSKYDDSTEIVYFRTEELAKQAVEILGEDTVRLALSTDW